MAVKAAVKTDGSQGGAPRGDLLRSRRAMCRMILRRTRSNICAPELYAVEGVVMRLLREWTAADQLIAAALTPRQQPAARAS